MFQFRADFRNRMKTELRVSLATAECDFIQRLEFGEIAGCRNIRKTEWIFTGAHHIDHFSYGINIAFRSRSPPAGTESRRSAERFIVKRRDQTRIGNFQNAADKQNIFRFQISMSDFAVVKLIHSRQNRFQIFHHIQHGIPFPREPSRQRVRQIMRRPRTAVVRRLHDTVIVFRRFAGMQNFQQVRVTSRPVPIEGRRIQFQFQQLFVFPFADQTNRPAAAVPIRSQPDFAAASPAAANRQIISGNIRNPDRFHNRSLHHQPVAFFFRICVI